MCQLQSQACGGECHDDDHYVCGDSCIGLDTACNGSCPGELYECHGKCYITEQYACGRKCKICSVLFVLLYCYAATCAPGLQYRGIPCCPSLAHGRSSGLDREYVGKKTVIECMQTCKVLHESQLMQSLHCFYCCSLLF